MNVNEVIANRANEILGARRGANDPIHPNDYVNMSQSSNDVFSSALNMATSDQVQRSLLPALTRPVRRQQRLDRSVPGQLAVDAGGGWCLTQWGPAR